MDPSYTTYWKTSPEIREIARCIETRLSGVSPDRIVSITHAMAIGPVWYSVLIVVRDAI